MSITLLYERTMSYHKWFLLKNKVPALDYFYNHCQPLPTIVWYVICFWSWHQLKYIIHHQLIVLLHPKNKPKILVGFLFVVSLSPAAIVCLFFRQSVTQCIEKSRQEDILVDNVNLNTFWYMFSLLLLVIVLIRHISTLKEENTSNIYLAKMSFF